MTFRVSVQPAAVNDLDEAVRFILTGGNPERAQRWLDGALSAIAELADNPEVGSLIPEARGLRLAYRHIHHYSHRIVYRVDEATQTVVVARVYHGARQALRAGDLRPNG